MARLWRTRIARRLELILALVLTATTLSACLGWYPQLMSTDGSMLGGISCPSVSVCFAVGSNASGNALVEQTTDAGGKWVTDTNGVNGLGLNAISCADPEHCVAVGGVNQGSSQSNTVLVTTDGGMSWSSSSDPSEGYLTSVSCPDVEDCWATAAVGIVGPSAVIATTDGGTSWANLPWQAPPLPGGPSGAMNSQLDAVTCPTTGNCLVVGEATYETSLGIENQGVISTTDDRGQTWQSQLIAVNGFTGISCPTSRDCVAVAENSVVPGQEYGYSAYHVVTADSGATWTVSTLAGGMQLAGGNAPAINAISCSDSLHCVAAGIVFTSDKYQTPVITTSDGGATWSSQATNPDNGELEAVDCVTSSSCWAVGFTSGGSEIIHTLTGGVAWPSVSNVSPGQGPVAGGSQVTISGAGFQYGTPSIEFGSTPATNVIVDSGSDMTATVPPSAIVVPSSGLTVDVTVTSPLGTSPLDSGDQYTYQSQGSSGSAVPSAASVESMIFTWLRLTGLQQ